VKRIAQLVLYSALLSAAPAAGQDLNAMQMQARNMAGREPQGDAVVTHDFAVCVARKQGGVRILEKLPNTNDEIDFVWGTSRYGEVNCGPQDRRPLVGARFMRGGAAEYLLERPHGRLEQEIFDMPNNEELARLGPDTRSAIIFIQIGECAARANPDGVKALLETEVRSADEAAAFQSVVPAVGGCVPVGLDFGIPPLLLRAYLAEGAYRNAVSDQAAAQETAG
jgi:hypothetical protein